MSEQPQVYTVRITDTADRMLLKIRKKYGKKTYTSLRVLILDLESEPDKKGEALKPPLAGLHSLHYSRFRVIFRINQGVAEVITVAVGHHETGSRDDIYEVVQRLVRSGIIDIERLSDPGTSANE